ncbi:MAG TPA: hypothetical protein VLU43_15615 [Anaeromyxobacteraceae bacterium]|nr:hypothetical protein [Anaeromyxobacteraceae bacterium]
MEAGLEIPAHPPQAAGAKRRVRNYLLDTSLQLRLASYLLAVAVGLSAVLGWLLWNAYGETSRVVALADPDVGESIATLLAREDRDRMIWLAAALGGVLLCLLGAAVVVTHRIAGPAFVIARTCRQVGEGNLARPRPLRSHDLLTDLADDVANMVEALREREDGECRAVLAAAGRLRDPTASAADRAAAVEALERLAREKSSRLAS